MHAVRIYKEPIDVADRLAPFGVTVDELVEVVEQIVAARNDVVSLDARVAAGTKAYLAGVRAPRMLLVPKGWEPDCTNGVESVVHPSSGIKIVYQSVDQACLTFKSPQAINGKGPAADDLVRKAQGCLFKAEELPEVAPADIERLNETIWFLCVSAKDEDVRAELSLPAAIVSGNFHGFVERIFIVKGGDWELRPRRDEGSGDDDYGFSISRK